MATEIPLYDYLELTRSEQRRIRFPISADLLAIKGRSRLAKRRHDAARDALRNAVAERLAASSRAPYRGCVTLSLTLAGRAAAGRHRAVKGLLDALGGCLYADDAQISLLEVTTLDVDDDDHAVVRTSSEGEYRRRFDAVRRGLERRDWDSWPNDNPGGLNNPWAWPDDVNDGWESLEEARKHLEWTRTTEFLEGSDREAIVKTSEAIYLRHLRRQLLEVPFGCADRPGAPPDEAREERVVINGHPLERLHPTACWLPAPVRGRPGSFKNAAFEAATALRKDRRALEVLREVPLVLDIALDGDGGAEFDLDNVASKVVKGFSEAFDWPSSQPRTYRIYRREGEEAGLLVRMRSAEAFRALERATGGYVLGLDFTPGREDYLGWPRGL